jgi:flavin-dependent dehydrogenase
VVAADGRHSALAQLLGNPSEAAENHRSALFGYFEGIATPEHDRSLFILSEPERGFLYPLCAGRTLLALYVPKSSAEQWQSQRASLEADIKSYFQRFPGVPDISRSKLVSPVFGYQDYPNLARKAVFNGIAFIGDAALSLDPLSGVGCGFAIVSGKLLAEATICALLERSDQAPALAAYESQFNKVILPHARGIRADSLIAKSEELSSQTYRCIASSATLQKQFVDLTGRLIAPMAFQRAFASAMVKAHAVAR